MLALPLVEALRAVSKHNQGVRREKYQKVDFRRKKHRSDLLTGRSPPFIPDGPPVLGASKHRLVFAGVSPFQKHESHDVHLMSKIALLYLVVRMVS